MCEKSISNILSAHLWNQAGGWTIFPWPKARPMTPVPRSTLNVFMTISEICWTLSSPEARLARQVICILEIFCWRQGGNLKIFVVGRNGGNAALVIVPDFPGFFKSKFDAYFCVFFLDLRLFPVCRKFFVQKRGKGIKIQNAKYRYEVQKANIKYTDSWECQCLWQLKRKIKEYKHDVLWSTLYVPYRCKNLKCSF